MSKITLALLAALSLAALTSTTCGFSDEEPGDSGQRTNRGVSSGSESSSGSASGGSLPVENKPVCSHKDRNKIDDLTQFCWGNQILDRCSGEEYNPTKHFCSGNKIYLLCGGEEYDPAKQGCGDDNKIYLKCGGNPVTPSQFCFNNNEVHQRCNGEIYNPSEQFCYKDALYKTCGNLAYNPEKQSCYELQIYENCANEEGEIIQYDKSKKRCIGNELYDKCGFDSYCKGDSAPYKLCGESLYIEEDESCINGNLYKKCDGAQYDSKDYFCSEDKKVRPLCNVIVGYSDFGTPLYEKKEYTSGEICDGNRIVPGTFTQGCGADILGDIPQEECCFGKRYDNSKQFCESEEVYDFCGDDNKEKKIKHNPLQFGCFKDKLYPLCGGTGSAAVTGKCVHSNGLLRCKQLGNGNKYVIDPLPGMTCNDNGSITGTARDARKNGRDYAIVQIGTQIWLAEDLKYDTTAAVRYDTMGVEIAGRFYLYDWGTAIKSPRCDSIRCPSNASELREGLCPTSFGIARTADWNALIEYAGGAAVAGGRLKSESGWKDGGTDNGNGTDAYGFNAKPGGYYTDIIAPIGYKEKGERAMWWTDNDYSPFEAYYTTIISSDTEVRTNFQQKGAYKASVRCVHYY